MLKKFISAAALGLALTACDDTCTETAHTSNASMNDGTFDGQFVPNQNDENDLQKVAGDRVFFALDSSNVNKTGKDTLTRQADWFKKNPDKSAVIEGHCDERGSDEYNFGLGERRAHAVIKQLINNGVDESRLKATSLGKQRPADEGHNEAAWSQNRRVVTTVN